MRTGKLIYLASLAAMLMILAACGISDSGTLTPVASPTGPAGATVSPGVLLTFSKTGGIDGINTTLTLQESGEYTLTERGQDARNGKVDDAQLNNIRQQLDAVRSLPNLEDEYDNSNVADDFYDSVTFTLNGSLKTVTVAEIGGQDLTPVPVQQLVNTLAGIVEAQ